MAGAAEDNRTLVVGLGATGLSAARFLAARGAEVVVIDSRRNPPGLEALRADHPELPVVLESLDSRWLEGVCRVVLSPGLGLDTPIAAEAARRGIPVISDIELFARAVEVPVIGVTGSNGKSTVVTLLQRLLSAAGVRAVAGGNLGPPALELLSTPAEAYVLEVSSFQLEITESLRPVAAAVLNVSADHLDRHGSFERYAALKAGLARAAGRFVFNCDDEVVRAMGRAHRRAIPFSVREPLSTGYSVIERGGERWLCGHGAPLLALRELRLPGLHNAANALAAVALADIVAEPLDEARERVLRTFRGLPHRCEWVAEDAGVVFVNDSKGTNVGATAAALRGLPGPFVLIAGGRSKGADFGPLLEAAEGKLAGAVVLGEAAAELGAALSGLAPVSAARHMAEAVARAAQMATEAPTRPITVLLSPACASLDMFADYRQRGEAFVAAVKERLQ